MENAKTMIKVIMTANRPRASHQTVVKSCNTFARWVRKMRSLAPYYSDYSYNFHTPTRGSCRAAMHCRVGRVRPATMKIINIYDLKGNVVQSSKVRKHSGSVTIPNGYYTIKVNSGNSMHKAGVAVSN